jgi:hypothetical protein
MCGCTGMDAVYEIYGVESGVPINDDGMASATSGSVDSVQVRTHKIMSTEQWVKIAVVGAVSALIFEMVRRQAKL